MVAAAVVIIQVILAACSGGGDQVSPPELRRVGQLSYIDSILYGDGTAKLALERRLQLEMNDCMREKGFIYPVALLDDSLKVSEAPRPVVTVLPFDSYGIVDRMRIASLKGATDTDPMSIYYQSLSQGQQAAFDAANASCWPGATSSVFEDYDRYESLRQELQSRRIEFGNAVDSDKQLGELNKRWSRCMATAGFESVASPIDAIELVTEKVEGSGANSETAQYEQQLAGADSQCRLEVSYNDIYEGVYLTLEASFVENNWALIMDVYRANFGRDAVVS